MILALTVLCGLGSIACSLLTIMYARRSARTWRRIAEIRAETAAIQAERISRYGA